MSVPENAQESEDARESEQESQEYEKVGAESAREQDNRGAAESESEYIKMLVAAHQACTRDSIYAAFFAWLTLAGYIVLPNIFESLQISANFNKGDKVVAKGIRSIQLLPLASLLCSIGIAGICSLWWKWRANYIWLATKLFL